MRIRFLILIIMTVFCIAVFYSCDGLFPSAPKNNIPVDHVNSISGFLHKSSGRNIDINDCLTCHSLELSGKVTNINGVNTWANSCYQCHGKLWNGASLK